MDKESLKNKITDEKIFNEMLDATFKNADLNQNDTIERNELAILLKSIYSSLGINAPEENEIDEEFNRLDENKDGKLSKEEFKVLVKDLALFSVENL